MTMKEDDAVGIMESSRHPRVYIRRDTYKGDTETGQQLQAIHGDEAELSCSRYKRIGKGEHQARSYQSEAERIPFTMLEERTQSDGCLT